VFPAFAGTRTKSEAAGSSKRTGYKWLRRFKLEGAGCLTDRNSRPPHSPTRLQLEKADIVFELRGKKRMTAAKIGAVLHLARSTVAAAPARGYRSAAAARQA
jgi:transposase